MLRQVCGIRSKYKISMKGFMIVIEMYALENERLIEIVGFYVLP
jgi:hypothetical protein